MIKIIIETEMLYIKKVKFATQIRKFREKLLILDEV